MLGVAANSLTQLDGISHRFFGRVGGTSPHPWTGLNTSFTVGDSPARVEENLARVRFQIGVSRRSLYTVTQVHGSHVVEVQARDDVDSVAPMEADALFTLAPEVAIAVRTADCAPILMASVDGRCVAAIHAGWRGATSNVVGATVNALAAAGVPPESLIAVVGPCIGQRAFEVGEEVVEAAQAVTDVSHLVSRDPAGRPHLDLAQLVAQRLREAGVGAVETLGACTVEEPDLWFSHRRERGRTGRQIAVIARTTAPQLDESTFT